MRGVAFFGGCVTWIDSLMKCKGFKVDGDPDTDIRLLADNTLQIGHARTRMLQNSLQQMPEVLPGCW